MSRKNRKRIQKNRSPSSNSLVSNKSLEKTNGRGASSVSLDPTKIDKLDFDGLYRLHQSSKFIQRIIGIPVTDALRDGFDIEFSNESDKKRFDAFVKKNKIDLEAKVEEVAIGKRVYGYSFVIPASNVEGNLSEVSTDGEILGFNYIEPTMVDSIEYYSSVLDHKFKHIKTLYVQDYLGTNYTKTSANRIKIIEENVFIDGFGVSYKGMLINKLDPTNSLINQLLEEISSASTTKWSLSELIYRANFILFKVDRSVAERDAKQDQFQRDLNTKTQAYMSKNDEAQVVNSANGVNPESWMNQTLMVISSATGIPVQRLTGQQKGAITGSEEDRKQYHDILYTVRRKELNPFINWAVNKISKNINLGEFSIKWNDIDESEDQEIETNTKKADLLSKLVDIYIKLANSQGQDRARESILDIATNLGFDKSIMDSLEGMLNG